MVANARAFKSERALAPNKKCAADIKVWADDYEQNSHTCEKCPIVFTTFFVLKRDLHAAIAAIAATFAADVGCGSSKRWPSGDPENSTSGEATESANFVSEYNNIIINISDRFDEIVKSKIGLSEGYDWHGGTAGMVA